MRMRYRFVTYRYSDGSQQQMERHYRQLLQDALRQSQQSILQHSVTWRPLADMKEEEIEVTLYEDALIVSGERHDDHEHGANLYYHEAQIRYGPFRVEVYIPASIDREAVNARYEDGFLWIDLPKLPV